MAKLPIHAIEPVSSQCGTILPVSFITIGYMGPRKKPTKEMAIASPISEGTSHATSSSLGIKSVVFKDE